MYMTFYKSKRYVDRLKWVIVDEDGKVVNNNPSIEKLKELEKEPRYFGDNLKGKRRTYTDEELLEFLRKFYRENGRPPAVRDFINNSEYPGWSTYQYRFGNWSNALKLAGLDVDSLIRKGIIENEYQKGRFGEIIVRDHFEKYPIDLAGENCNSPCDGICPNGKTYDVKSSGLRSYFQFGIDNKEKDNIEILYLLAFNEDYSKLMYAWRIITWEFMDIIEKDIIYIGFDTSSRARLTIKNMTKYEITQQIRDVLNKYGYFEKIKNYRKKKLEKLI